MRSFSGSAAYTQGFIIRSLRRSEFLPREVAYEYSEI